MALARNSDAQPGIREGRAKSGAPLNLNVGRHPWLPMLNLALAVSAVSAVVFSTAYLYFLGLRIIRKALDDKTSAFFTALVVGCGILTATVTLEAVLLIGLAREVAGSLFYAAAAFGIFVATLGTAGVVAMPKPIAVALAHRKAATWGLVIGNLVLACVNALSFSGVLPSAL